MTDIYRPVDWSVQQLISAITSGTLRLPDLQRPFVWPATKVRDLLDSMYRGYPVGELMFWNQHGSEDTHTIGSSGGAQTSTHLIVDGQQRLTSLYVAVTGKSVVDDEYRIRHIRISFNPLLERFEVAQPALDRSADWVPDVTAVFTSPLVALTNYKKRLEQVRGELLAEEEEARIFEALNRLSGLQQRMFKVVEIQPGVSKATVADVFVRINSEGVNLTSADFILTWLSVFWPGGREQMEDFARNSRLTAERVTEITGVKTNWTPKNHFIAPTPGQLVRVAVGFGQGRGRMSDAYAALRARDRKTGLTDPERQAEELQKIQTALPQILNPLNWDEFIRVLSRAGFRSRKMITSNNAILYCYALWLLGKTKYEVDTTNLRDLMARWFFMIHTTGRYTSSPETKFQSDLDRFDSITDAGGFVKTINGMINTVFTNDYWNIRLPDAFISSSTNTPAFQAYLASLDILDADLFLLPDGKVRQWTDPTATSIRNVEIHHIFPRAHLRNDLGYTDTKRINQIANYAPIDWVTNQTISAASPAEYWPQIKQERFPQAGPALDRQHLWFALPDGWDTMPYEDFLHERRRLMAQVVKEGYMRLSDPTYEPAYSTLNGPAGDLDIDVTLLNLMGAGLLEPGTIVESVDTDDDIVAVISDEGEIVFDDHFFESPTRAAKAAGEETRDGWDYWTIDTKEGTLSLADLRADYVARGLTGEVVADA